MPNLRIDAIVIPVNSAFTGKTPGGAMRRTKGSRQMPTWLILIIIGAVLLIVGVAVEAAKILIWIGIAVLVVSLILGLLRRGKARV